MFQPSMSRAKDKSRPPTAAAKNGVCRDGGGGGGETTVRATIPSNFRAGREVQERIMGEVAKCSYSEECVFAIRLALEEALINAIKHGNKLDPNKTVRVECRIGAK